MTGHGRTWQDQRGHDKAREGMQRHHEKHHEAPKESLAGVTGREMVWKSDGRPCECNYVFRWQHLATVRILEELITCNNMHKFCWRQITCSVMAVETCQKTRGPRKQATAQKRPAYTVEVGAASGIFWHFRCSGLGFTRR